MFIFLKLVFHRKQFLAKQHKRNSVKYMQIWQGRCAEDECEIEHNSHLSEYIMEINRISQIIKFHKLPCTEGSHLKQRKEGHFNFVFVSFCRVEWETLIFVTLSIDLLCRDNEISIDQRIINLR